MSPLTPFLTRILSEGEAAVDWVRFRARRGRETGPFHVVAYRGHGTNAALYLSGRVMAGKPISPARASDGPVRNLLNTVRRLESDEVPAARVRARVGGSAWEVLADDEGYFQLRMEVASAADEDPIWRVVDLELLDPLPAEGPAPTAVGYVAVPPRDARFGVISDIDDTVVKTDVTNLLRMLRLVLLTNAHTRLPFEGVAAFYRALQHGAAGAPRNPIFYVSSSPWNFYDLLNEVFEVHGIPAGPLFLKDYGLAPDLLLSVGHREHKLNAIEEILVTHPGLPFVLIGDSGQEDPEIYREVVRRHPGRVEAVYIRDVSPGGRQREVRAVADELAREGVEMVLVSDTVEAARHAAARGLIDPSSLPDVHGEKAKDEAAPGPIESVVDRR